MTIRLPSEVENLKWLVGIDPPEADEDALWRSARAWRAAAGELRLLASEATRTGADVVAAIEGDAATAFAQAWQPFVAGDGLVLRLADACEELAAACDHAATEVEYAKLAFIVALVALAATLAALTASLVAGGVSALGMPLAIAGAQLTIRMLLARLVVAIAVGAAVNLALDSVVQSIQLLEGNRDHWDTTHTVRALEDGAIYGAATGLVFLGGARLAPGLLGNPWGVGAALAVTGGLGGVGAGLVHGETPTATGVVMAVVSGVVGGLGPGPTPERPHTTEAERVRLDPDGPTLAGYADVYQTDPWGLPADAEGAPRPAAPTPAPERYQEPAPHTPGGGGSFPVAAAAGSGPGALPPAPGPPGTPVVRSEPPLRADQPPPVASSLGPAGSRPAGNGPAGPTPAGNGPAGPPDTIAPGAALPPSGVLTPVPPGTAGPVAISPATGATTVPGGTVPGGAGPALGSGPARPDAAAPAVIAAVPLCSPALSAPASGPTALSPTASGPSIAGPSAPAHSGPSLDTITMTSGHTGPALPVTDAEAVGLARRTAFETDAGYGFYASGDTTRDFAQAVGLREGYVTLDVHGTPRGFRIEGGLLTAEQFAGALRELEREGALSIPPGAGIKLISCDTATGGAASPAAALARALGVEVIAPDQPVWTAMDGEEIVASPTVRDGMIVPVHPPDGHWHRFDPETDAATPEAIE